MEPSWWQGKKIFDDFCMWGGLAFAPVAALTLYANVFIGPAKIAPIPDGYEPLDEEYSYHPITRWMQRYFHRTEQHWYEITLHERWQRWRTAHKVRLMAEVHRQMKMEGDYAAYYYHPGAHAKYARIMKEEVEMIQRIEGGSDK